MEVRIEESWKERLRGEFERDYFRELVGFVRDEYKSKKIFPPPTQIFRAFDLCSFDDVKVVILGQDPYHGLRQANGLCFAVNEGVGFPPSLQNIFKEMQEDVGGEIPKSGDLSYLSKQGVLLLNATLTVVAHSAGSHQNKGWEEFTDAVIEKLSDEREGLVFLLWGRYARDKGAVIDRMKHLVLECAHPSPFSASYGFFGCRHFSKANEYLESKGREPVKWLL